MVDVIVTKVPLAKVFFFFLNLIIHSPIFSSGTVEEGSMVGQENLI